MRGTALLLLLSCGVPAAMAQAAIRPHVALPVITPQMPAPVASAPAKPAAAAKKSDPADQKFRDNVQTLIGVTGLREELLKNQKTLVEKDKEDLMRKHPELSPSFANEAARRLAKRMSPDDYLNLVVEVYEKNFTNQDVQEMIHAKLDSGFSNAAAISPRLKAKMQAESGKVHAQILSGFAELGQKLSTQIQKEIATEHPEWLTRGQEPFKTSSKPVQSTPAGEFATVVAADAENSPNFVVTTAN
jgi:2-oxo-4-hydroxy-4-carboxy--5-ureidoimidazoline (OHCU) decarboxylase